MIPKLGEPNYVQTVELLANCTRQGSMVHLHLSQSWQSQFHLRNLPIEAVQNFIHQSKRAHFDF